MKLTALFLSLLLAFSLPVAPVSAEITFDTPISLTVNQTLIKTDSKPFLYRGTTFVPIRFISEALGAESVSWDTKKDTATIIHQNKTIALPKNGNVAYVNGERIKIENGSKLVNGRTYVPVRFVAEELSCDVEWIFRTYTVNVSKDGIIVPAEMVEKRNYSDDDIYWLSKIIHAESQGEPMKGKIAVGNVVLNRVKSRDYPNTIYGVIFDRQYGVQFSPVLDGSIYQTPLGDSVIAAKRALEGENEAGNSLFFLNPKTAQSSWIIHNRPFYTTIKNHDFYL